jgi:glycosyltransferase involved in cell wall biosynthesis
MNVIHIITGLNDGGAEAVLYRLCLSDKSFNHIVVSLMDEGKYGSLLADNDIKVYCLRMKRGRISLAGLLKLYKIIRNLNPNVVQTWMYHADLIGGFVSRLAGIKNVVWGVHHTNLVKGGSKLSTIILVRINAILSNFIPKNIIYCAHKSKHVHEEVGYNISKAFVIGNGYNINQFFIDKYIRDSFRNKLNLTNEENLLGMVGRYDPLKDHLNLVMALNKIIKAGYNIKLILVGKDLDINNRRLINQIKENELLDKIFLMGQRNDISAVMNALDLNILSSLSEAFPNVLPEAMACGTPCVTTDVGDAALIVGNTGWVVPPKDPLLLANAIMQALDEKQLNQHQWLDRKYKCRSRIVDNFCIERMVSNYHNVWISEK